MRVNVIIFVVFLCWRGVDAYGYCILSLSGSGSKSATGLLEWLEVDSALDAFVMTNHQTAFSQSKYFTLANPFFCCSFSIIL